ncbi:hypothetical protein ACA910_010645 [Epithemia clementina (nom. ined.)]
MIGFAVLFVLCLVTLSQAFQTPVPTFAVRKAMPSSTSLSVILSDEEVEAIMKAASDCAAGECAVDDVSELIFELEEQQKVMQERLEKTVAMIASLKKLNEKTKNRDEVRAFVKDMLRVFSNEKPTFPIMGFTGDVGDGPKTAWDVLPPKPWSPNPK